MSFITHNKNSFPIQPSAHPAIVSASDVHDRKPSARVVAKMGKSLVERANKIKDNAKKRREQKLLKLTFRINDISNSDYPNNQKIESLQRLLNNHSKEMDKSMIDRVRRELADLHKTKDPEHERAFENHRSENDPKVEFIKPTFIGNPSNPKDFDEKIIGHDRETNEAITSFGNRIAEHDKIPPAKSDESFSDYKKRLKDFNEENKTLDESDDDKELPIEARYAGEVLKQQVN